MGGGLTVYNSTSGKLYTLLYDTSSGPFVLYSWNTTTSLNAAVFSTVVMIGLATAAIGRYVYISVTNNATNLIWGASMTGIPGTFVTLGTTALATFITSVSHVGIVNGNSLTGGFIVADWFRRTA